MWIRQLWAGPVFEDEDKTRVARLLNWILLTLFALNLIDVILLAVFAPETLPTFWLNGLLFVFTAISFWMMRRGMVSVASLVLLVALWLLLIYYLPQSGGVTSPALGFLSIIVIGGAVLLGARGVAAFGLLSVVTAIILYWAGRNGWLTSIEGPPTPARLFATQTTIFLSLTMLMAIGTWNVQDALARARRAGRELTARNRDLEREIAGRERAEEAYRVLVEHSLQGLIIFQDNRIVFANPAIAQMLGYTVGGLLAVEDPTALLHPDDREKVLGHLQARLVEQPAPAQYEFRFVRKDGDVRWAEIFATLITYRDRPALQTATIDITERKQVEFRLRQSEEELRQLSDAAFEGIGIAEQGKIILVNRQLAEMLGYEVSECVGMSVMDLVAPESRDLVSERIRSSYEGPYEHLSIRKDGTIFPVEVHGRTMTFAGRQVRVTAVRDITERKRTEEVLAAEHNLLRTLIDTLPDHIYIKDIDSRFVLANPATAHYLGVNSVEALIGKTDLDFFPPDEAKRYFDDEQALIRSGQNLLAFDSHSADPTGNIRWLHVTKVPYRDNQGNIVGLVGANRDITERKQAEEALRRSEERFAKAFYANPASISISTVEEGRYMEVNDAWLDVAGFSREEVLGRTGLELGLWDDPESRPGHTRTLREQGRLRQVESSVRDKSGKEHHLLISVEIVRIGEEDCVLSMSLDITERKQMEAVLEQALQDLEQRVEERTADLQQANHDLEREVTERRRAEAAEHEQRLLAEALRDIGAALSKTLHLEDILDQILVSIGRVVPYDAVNIMFIENGAAHVVRHRGFAERGLEDWINDLEFAVNEVAVVDRMFQSGQPNLIVDTRLDPTWPRDPERQWIRSHAGAPILSDDRIVGFVNLCGDTPGDFTLEHLDRLKIFSELAAIAIRNAQLFQKAGAVAAYEERQRLARDLHDAVTQTMFSASIIAETLLQTAEGDPAQLRQGLIQLQRLTRGAVAEMRALLFELRPETLENMDLPRLLTQLAQAVEARTGITPAVVNEGQASLPQEVKIAVYRIAQEAFNNIGKHASATQISLNSKIGTNRIELAISDNGRGYAPDSGGPGHFGLQVMRERAETIGAALRLTSAPGKGTTITLEWKGDLDG